MNSPSARRECVGVVREAFQFNGARRIANTRHTTRTAPGDAGDDPLPAARPAFPPSTQCGGGCCSGLFLGIRVAGLGETAVGEGDDDGRVVDNGLRL